MEGVDVYIVLSKKLIGTFYCVSMYIYQVTWVEHVEVDGRSVHNIYMFLNSVCAAHCTI
jgi:hypothetical protein